MDSLFKILTFDSVRSSHPIDKRIYGYVVTAKGSVYDHSIIIIGAVTPYE